MRKLHMYSISLMGVCIFSGVITPASAQVYDAQTVVGGTGTDSVFISSVPKPRGLETNTTGSITSPQPRTPAPPLTNVVISNVCTSAAGNGCEAIGSGQLTTANTYSGSQVYTFVWEIGYGTGEIAHQGGMQLTNAYLMSKSGVCINGNTYTVNCPAGSSIVGWRYVWNVGYWLSHGYAENFAAQDTSINVPINTYYANLTIKYSN